MRIRSFSTAALAAATLLFSTACGGDAGSSETADTADGSAGNAASSGAIPVEEPAGPVDARLAERGEQLFRSRGCISCHTLGEGRRVGPDLEGVTERRSFEWTYHMVMNPDSMLQNDSIAQQLLSEYFTPMADQNLEPEQFRAIYEYLRSEDEETEGS